MIGSQVTWCAGRSTGLPSRSVTRTPSLRQHRHVAIREKKDVARVLQQRRNIAGHEIFAVAQPDHRRRPDSRGNQFLRVLRGKKHQRIDAAQVLQRLAHRFFERQILRVFFHQMRHDLRIRLGDELVAFLLQLFLQLQIIFDDPVVHHHILPGAIAMRVRIFFRGTSVSGPARVANSIGSLNR